MKTPLGQKRKKIENRDIIFERLSTGCPDKKTTMKVSFAASAQASHATPRTVDLIIGS